MQHARGSGGSHANHSIYGLRTSAMTSVAFALPMARRRLLRMAQAFASSQSCRMVRSSQTSPSLPGGMVSAQQRPHQVSTLVIGTHAASRLQWKFHAMCQTRLQLSM